jgi:ATP-dependent protease ClpP protease subunit
MTAEEAKAFGLIDQVVVHRDPPEKGTLPKLAAQ